MFIKKTDIDQENFFSDDNILEKDVHLTSAKALAQYIVKKTFPQAVILGIGDFSKTIKSLFINNKDISYGRVTYYNAYSLTLNVQKKDLDSNEEFTSNLDKLGLTTAYDTLSDNSKIKLELNIEASHFYVYEDRKSVV